MNVGTEWLVDAEGCSSDLLRDPKTLRDICDEVISDLGLRVVGEPLWHQFPAPGGLTGLYLLTESHLTCHTFPESGQATFNLYCCRPRPRFAWEHRLRSLLGAGQVRVQTCGRGNEIVFPSVMEPANDPHSFEDNGNETRAREVSRL